MARPFLPQIATANHLLEGDAVYFTAQRDWSRSLGDALVAHTPQDAEALLLDASQHPGEVVGPYLANVRIEADGGPVPAHFREMFRTRGPSNYFHGKQAALLSAAAQPRPARRGRAPTIANDQFIPARSSVLPPAEPAHVPL